MQCTELTSVSIQATTNVIVGYGDNQCLLFANCIKLNEVSIIPFYGVIESSFSNCINLQTVTLPDTKTFETNAFLNCRNLQTITIGDSGIDVREYAFSGCSKLTSFPFDKVTKIGNGAFSYCTSLDIDQTVTIDGKKLSFVGCSNLKKSLLSQQML